MPDGIMFMGKYFVHCYSPFCYKWFMPDGIMFMGKYFDALLFPVLLQMVYA